MRDQEAVQLVFDNTVLDKQLEAVHLLFTHVVLSICIVGIATDMNFQLPVVVQHTDLHIF